MNENLTPVQADDDLTESFLGESEEYSGLTTRLLGTLDIIGGKSYVLYANETKAKTTWLVAEQGFVQAPHKTQATLKAAASRGESPVWREDLVVAAVVKTTGSLKGYGETHILSRMLDVANKMTTLAFAASDVKPTFFNGVHIKYSGDEGAIDAQVVGRRYKQLAMTAGGFIVNLSQVQTRLGVTLPDMLPMIKEEAAVVASSFSVSSAKLLIKKDPERFKFLNGKKYSLLDSNQLYIQMMHAFLSACVSATQRNVALLVGIDTETTGVNMFNLAADNEFGDHIVAIPFSWEDDVSYVICTDMYYFSNVDEELIYPVFHQIFRRNEDFTAPIVKIDFQGAHYEFNRRNIIVGGYNSMFDQQAFLCHGADVFFDEDGRTLFFNLATDWVQGRNGLKDWTHRLFDCKTADLAETLGHGNEDKYRYISDRELALLYGAPDADFTRLCIKKGREFTPNHLLRHHTVYDMTVKHILGHAAWEGMNIDEKKVKAVGALLEQDLETIRTFIYRYAYRVNKELLSQSSADLARTLGYKLDADLAAMNKGDLNKEFRYKFSPANHRRLLYDKLRYPVFVRTASGEPALNKTSLEKMMAVQIPKNERVTVLEKDILSAQDGSVLISADKFNADKYPLARVLSVYATLNKEYSAYFKPILDNDLESKMFFNITMERAATRRILSPGQTLKGSLKYLYVAPKDKLFFAWDVSQMEYRIMVTRAYHLRRELLQKKYPDDWEERFKAEKIYSTFNRMLDPDSDYHIETAAASLGIQPHKVTKKVRKRYKCLGFGIPYGLSLENLCINLHGEKTDEYMAETKQLYEDYMHDNDAVIAMLEEARDQAFKPAQVHPEFRNFLSYYQNGKEYPIGDTPLGIVKNDAGFYRMFILNDRTRRVTASIRRKSGNFRIQGGAAEYFRMMIFNLQKGMCAAGINDKYSVRMVVHDETDGVCDQDIDIVKFIKVMHQCCTLRFEESIPLFIGIGLGHNWYDAKDDRRELPVKMVDRMIEAYDAGTFSIPCDGQQPENLLRLKRHFMCDRVYEELIKILPDLKPGYVFTAEDLAKVDDEFMNYTVRGYLPAFASKGDNVDEGTSLSITLPLFLKAREEYGFGVDFLQTKFKDAREELATLTFDVGDTSASDDMQLDLGADDLLIDELGLSNIGFGDSDDNMSERADDNDYFDEQSLGDFADRIETLGESEDLTESGYRSSEDFWKTWEVNPNATNAFEVLQSSTYMRTKVLKAGENVYSVLLYGTSYLGREKDVLSLIKSKSTPGVETIAIIGKSQFKVENIGVSEEFLDTLDKILCGKYEVNTNA